MEKVVAMGGRFDAALSTETTHLVSGSLSTQKYREAAASTKVSLAGGRLTGLGLDRSRQRCQAVR